MRKICSLLTILVVTVSFAQESKYFRLIASMGGQLQLENGPSVPIWGYTFDSNDTLKIPSPILVVEVGDTVEIEMVNQSSDAHTIHLHGLDVDQANDGVPSTSQPITGSGSYHFVADHPGLYIYHCHVKSTVHVQMGMFGLVLVRPLGEHNKFYAGGPTYTKEKQLVFSTIDDIWQLTSGFVTSVADFKPNHFFINGKEGTDLLAPSQGIEATLEDTVCLRLMNIAYGSTKVVFPAGVKATNIMSDGRALPVVEEVDTIEIFPGERYELALTAEAIVSDSLRILYYDMESDEPFKQNAISLKFSPVVGLHTYHVPDLGLKVYPSHSSKSVTIEVDEEVLASQSARLMVVSSCGHVQTQQVLSKAKKRINVSGYATGKYSVLLELDGFVFSEDFIKTK